MPEETKPDIALHPATEELLGWFNGTHLQPELAKVVVPFMFLAEEVAKRGGGPECTVALRKLLEAKDAAVRAAIKVQRSETVPAST